MDLLETVLTQAGATQYMNKFLELNMTAATLKELSDEDLSIMGIPDEETRENILKFAHTLHIARETKELDDKVDTEYVKAVLDQMTMHLNRQVANLSIACSRDDVLICDQPFLSWGVGALESALQPYKRQLEEYKRMMVRKEKKDKFKRNVCLSTVFATSFAIVAVILWQKRR